MKTKLLALLLLAGGSMFAHTSFSIGIGVGVPAYYPPPAPVVAYAPPPYPGPGYTWVDGYWYPAGPRWAWRAGYWAPAPFAGAYWVAPRYYGGHYYDGYWGRRAGWERHEAWEHGWRRFGR